MQLRHWLLFVFLRLGTSILMIHSILLSFIQSLRHDQHENVCGIRIGLRTKPLPCAASVLRELPCSMQNTSQSWNVLFLKLVLQFPKVYSTLHCIGKICLLK